MWQMTRAGFESCGHRGFHLRVAQATGRPGWWNFQVLNRNLDKVGSGTEVTREAARQSAIRHADDRADEMGK